MEMNPLKPIEYLFYRIYDWDLRTWGKLDVPQYNALFGVSFLMLLNIYLAADLVELIFGDRSFEFGVVSAVLFYITVVIFNFFLLVRNGRYEKIAQRFREETKFSRRINLAWCVVYVIFTFACALIFPYIRH